MTKQTAPDITSARFASEVRAEMARQLKTAGQMAQALDITPHTAGKRLNGRVRFSMVESARVAEWLGVDLLELLRRATAANTHPLAVAS